MEGALVVDKPAGPTSHDVVARVRRAAKISRVGHTGTLDPLATGVLVLLLGRATRLARFLASDEKEYVAGVRLGCATPTYDAENRLVRTPEGRLVLAPPSCGPVDVPEATLRDALAALTGTYPQMPPLYSAKKVAGTAAHRLARAAKPIALQPVQVTVRELELLRHDGGLATLRIVSSSGFYVRSLAHELGERLGCGAHLESLRRTRAGEMDLSRSVTLDAIEAEGPGLRARLVPPDQLLSRLPHVVVNDRGARRAGHGNALGPQDLERQLPVPAGDGGGPIRVLDARGGLVAVAEPDGSGVLQPIVVLV